MWTVVDTSGPAFYIAFLWRWLCVLLAFQTVFIIVATAEPLFACEVERTIDAVLVFMHNLLSFSRVLADPEP